MTTFWVGMFWVVLAYLVGAIPFGYLFVRLNQGKDIRQVGSGNIGATNVMRTSGWATGLVTLFLDAAKGYLAVLTTEIMTHQDKRFMALSAGAAVLEHAFPVYLKFKGGKGVATSAGALLLWPSFHCGGHAGLSVGCRPVAFVSQDQLSRPPVSSSLLLIDYGSGPALPIARGCFVVVW
jgi:acyl-phosphate glycerol 3-phosphate acyltransferase